MIDSFLRNYSFLKNKLFQVQCEITYLWSLQNPSQIIYGIKMTLRIQVEKYGFETYLAPRTWYSKTLKEVLYLNGEKNLVFNVLEVMTHLSFYLRIKNSRNCVTGTAHKLCSPADSGTSGFLLVSLKYLRIYPLIQIDMWTVMSRWLH